MIIVTIQCGIVSKTLPETQDKAACACARA